MTISKPMLACSTIPNPEDVTYPVMASPKLDGIRCLIGKDHKAYSRNGKLIPNEFIQQTLQALRLPQLDGELMVAGDFNDVQSGIMRKSGEPDFTYHVFDTLIPLAYPVFCARTECVLNYCLELAHPRVQAVKQSVIVTSHELSVHLQQCLDAGYEGSIVRDPQSKYKHGRSTLREGAMLKLKIFKHDEALVTGFEELMRNEDTSTKKQANLVGADILGCLVVVWKGKELRLGSGFDNATRKLIWDNKEDYIGRQATFQYQELSKNGIPRFPTFKSFRSDI